MRIAVLIKQVPKFEGMELGADGRLRRDGLELEMNPYCRRAVSKGVELVAAHGESCTVVTLGPPAAEDSLREAIAWGATDGILVTDPAFAGSDTLATARAIASVLRREGPFDLVLAGRNSVDADTGQVPPEVAELLDLPFLGGVRRLDLDGQKVRARCEHDDGWVEAETSLPCVLSCAERLCDPAKVDPEGCAAVDGARIRTLTAADVGVGPWGQAGSPTRVGAVRLLESERHPEVLSGPVPDQVSRAVELLADRGALRAPGWRDLTRPEDDATPHGAASPIDNGAGVGTGGRRSGPVFAVVCEPDRPQVSRELLGAAARLAGEASGRVVALGPDDLLAVAGSWGADDLVVLRGSMVEDDVADAVGRWCAERQPFAVLLGATMWGREVGARIAARLGAGLTGDAVDITYRDGRAVGWKPAFGGQLVAAVTATSQVQMLTVRPGVLSLSTPRATARASQPAGILDVPARGRVHHLDRGRDDDVGRLARADVVVGVGTGVKPDEYAALDALLAVLGAELAATRKVTDKGWLPRSRQVGITGRSIGPRLYVAVGLAGKFNHMVGVRGAGQILAINEDPGALVFGAADVGIVADWHDAVPQLVAALEARGVSEGSRSAPVGAGDGAVAG